TCVGEIRSIEDRLSLLSYSSAFSRQPAAVADNLFAGGPVDQRRTEEEVGDGSRFAFEGARSSGDDGFRRLGIDCSEPLGPNHAPEHLRGSHLDRTVTLDEDENQVRMDALRELKQSHQPSIATVDLRFQ